MPSAVLCLRCYLVSQPHPQGWGLLASYYSSTNDEMLGVKAMPLFCDERRSAGEFFQLRTDSKNHTPLIYTVGIQMQMGFERKSGGEVINERL